MDLRTEARIKHFGKEIYEVLFEILIDKRTGNLHKNHSLSLIEVLKDYRLEPSVVYLLGDILTDHRQCLLPPGIFICFHFAVLGM